MTCQYNNIQVGSVGFTFNVQLISNFQSMNVSDATSKKIYFLKPDGTKSNHDLVFLNDGSNGKLYYSTVAGDIDQAGTWKMQANIVTPSDNWWTSIQTFTVQGNLS